GKRKKKAVQEFQYRLMDNVLALNRDLAAKTYVHGPYHAFNISDPKPRNIHTASVRDRLLHHALYRKPYPFFDRTFIADSYSCRQGKGTHAAMDRFRQFSDKVSLHSFASGVDFLGWVHFPDHRVLRTATKRRMLTRIGHDSHEASVASYRGLLKHGNTRKLQAELP
ncbi:MAG: hypothetical protein AAB908_00325, partial [Patescibacteria group bacterium]